MSTLSQIAATSIEKGKQVSCLILSGGHDHLIVKRDGEIFEQCLCGHRTKGIVVAEWQYDQARRLRDEQAAKHDDRDRRPVGIRSNGSPEGVGIIARTLKTLDIFSN